MYGFGKALDRLHDGALVRRAPNERMALRLRDGRFEARSGHMVADDVPEWLEVSTLHVRDLLAEDWCDAEPESRGGQVITPDLANSQIVDGEGYDGR